MWGRQLAAIAGMMVLTASAAHAALYVYQLPDGSRIVTDHALSNREYKLVRTGEAASGIGRLVAHQNPQLFRTDPSAYDLLNGKANVTDAIDNDRDNYVDERTLVLQRWTTNPVGPPVAEVQLGTNIQSIRVTRTGRLITVVLTVMRYDATMREVRTFVHRAETSLRN